jgi:signal transduction histidine kinase
MQDICKQIENIHSELSKMNLADKIGYIIGKQAEINSYANQLAQNRALRGFFTLEEQIAVRQLQDIQNDLNTHKADINREIHDEIGKELFKTIVSLGRYT